MSPGLFNLHAEYIMHKPGLDESQAGTKTAGRNISHLRYADDTTPLAESILEKEMAPHSIVLAWRIPGMAEPGGLQSMGSHRIGHD